MNDDSRSSEAYRQVLATASKLETFHTNVESVIDFFVNPLSKLHSKLGEDCFKLLFHTKFKLDYFRKAEELVWKRNYHSIHQFYKSKRQQSTTNPCQQEFLIESHLISGIGYYSCLIVKLRSHYHIRDAYGIIEPLNLLLGPIDNFIDAGHIPLVSCLKNANGGNPTSTDTRLDVGNCDNSATTWARQAIYRSLVYQGDLSRYMIGLSKLQIWSQLAFSFYKSASRYQGQYGLPFNQIATIVGSVNHNLDAICNYVRSCLRPKPYEGAEVNMKRVFAANDCLHRDLVQNNRKKTISEILASKEPSQEAQVLMQRTIVAFIKLTADIWYATSSSIDRLQVCEDGFKDTYRIFFENFKEAIDLGSLATLWDDSNTPRHHFNPLCAGLLDDFTPRHVTPALMYELASTSLHMIVRCEQFKRKDLASAAFLSELAIDITFNLLHYCICGSYKSITGRTQSLRLAANEFLELSSTYDYIYCQTYLPTVKILCDWLLSNRCIVPSKLNSFPSFATDLEQLVTSLNEISAICDVADSTKNASYVLNHAYSGPTWTQKYPLSCDFPLWGLSIMRHVHELNIDFEHGMEINDIESGYITTQCILAFYEALMTSQVNKSPQ